MIRRVILFTAGIVLLVLGSAGVILGLLFIFVKAFYFYGIGSLILGGLFAAIGWEFVHKASEVPVPDYASEDKGSFDPTLHQVTARTLYDRHDGSSFGSGF
ncbi:MAG: hypothetical protein D6785_08235 [Planctomycetota bacterium]|nr:MAG: hypothetical protein D6785_08235 [Planctomycetota bacterium]